MRYPSSQRNLESSLSKSQTKGHYYTFENTLSYEKTFAEKHSISALVGYTNEWGKQETLQRKCERSYRRVG